MLFIPNEPKSRLLIFGYISIELIELGLESKTQIKTLLNIII
jgi:hypothetical protein